MDTYEHDAGHSPLTRSTADLPGGQADPAPGRRALAVLRHMPGVAVVCREDGYVIWTTADEVGALGHGPGAFGGWGGWDLVHPADADMLRVALGRCAADGPGGTALSRLRMRTAVGDWAVVEAFARNTLHDPDVGGILVLFHNVTPAATRERDLRRRTAELARQARFDPLTGLPNRAALVDRIGSLEGAAPGTGTAVLFVDLDGFKLVNDSHGHRTGDRVLTVCARRLRAAVREGDVVGRWGGDEFVVLVDRPDVASVHATARRLIETVEAPIDVDGSTVTLSASVGVVVGGAGRGEDAVGLADDAMYRAKRSGRGRIAVIDISAAAATVEPFTPHADPGTG